MAKKMNRRLTTRSSEQAMAVRLFWTLRLVSSWPVAELGFVRPMSIPWDLLVASAVYSSLPRPGVEKLAILAVFRWRG